MERLHLLLLGGVLDAKAQLGWDYDRSGSNGLDCSGVE